MDFALVGKKILELRKFHGLSQGELAEGICSQAQISKIEKGEVYPLATTLYFIAKKLGVDVNYFFDISSSPRIDYLNEVESLLIDMSHHLKYQDMYQLVRTELKNPLCLQNKEFHQLLLWKKGVCQYHLLGDVKGAIETLVEGIALTQSYGKVWSERILEITLSMGIIYLEEGKLIESESVLKVALLHAEKLMYFKDPSVKARIYYHYARVLTKQKDYHGSLSYCVKSMDGCIKNNQMYPLGELFYQQGYNYELLGDFDKAKALLEKALFISQLQKKQVNIDIIEERLRKVESLCTPQT